MQARSDSGDSQLLYWELRVPLLKMFSVTCLLIFSPYNFVILAKSGRKINSLLFKNLGRLKSVTHLFVSQTLLSFQLLIHHNRKNNIKGEGKKQVNLKSGSLKEKGLANLKGRLRGKWEYRESGEKYKKKGKDEEDTLAPFCLNTHLRLGLRESNSDLQCHFYE